MQFIRTMLWILLTIVLVAFIAINWLPVRVNIWPDGGDYYNVQWPVGLIVLIAYLLGLGPMWLLHRAQRWHARRRIASLESALTAATPAPPLATATQLDAATASAADPAA